MILNVSGRTDIVAFYMNWFVNRWKAGFFDVQNPFDEKQVSRILVEDVDMIVFCTKNPIPLLKTIHMFQVPIQLQVTITGYFQDIEESVYDKKKIIEAVCALSKMIGKENVCVRYDPILLNEKYSAQYHVKAFQRLCCLLNGSVSKMIVSFLDDYKNVRKNHVQYHQPDINEFTYIKNAFEACAHPYNMKISSCMETIYCIGDEKDCCVSIKYAFERTGKLFKPWKARKCGCATMVDVGAYNSCLHGCKYCYANFDCEKVLSNYRKHDENSSLLIGYISKDAQIKERKK